LSSSFKREKWEKKICQKRLRNGFDVFCIFHLFLLTVFDASKV
jgi:hypothetical protein